MSFELIINPDLKDVKVSLIIPVYNVEEYIEVTCSSLVNQSLKNIEIIFVDDGSSDQSVELIKQYAKDYPNIVLGIQDNSGPGTARNNGKKIARGEYIGFVDSDDLLPHDAIEAMYQAAIDENADVVTGQSLSFNSTQKWFIGSHVSNGVNIPGEKSLISTPGLLYSLGPCNKLFKATHVKNINFPKNIKVTEDHPFIIEAYLKANRIFTVDKVIYYYRSREDEDNISLSQIVRVNSVKVINDILKSLSISDPLWDQYVVNKFERNQLKAHYYQRIVMADIWPAVNSAIRSMDTETQVESLKLFLEFVNKIDIHLYNKIPAIPRILSYEFVNRYHFMSPEAKRIHLDLLKVWEERLNPEMAHQLITSKFKQEVNSCLEAVRKNSLSPINSLVRMKANKKRKNKFSSRLKSAFARRVVLNFAKMLPMKDEIIFASNKSTGLQDSYYFIYEELIKTKPEYKIIGHFIRKRNFSELCKMYYDFGRAKYVILNDYHRPLYNVNLRKDTKIIQVWHACGAFKKFGLSAVGYKDSNSKDFEIKAHTSYSNVIVSCDEIIPFYAEAFNVPESKVLALGLPRTDFFYNDEMLESVKNNYFNKYPMLKGKKIITYAPTFRGSPKERKNFNLQLNLIQMANNLQDEYVLVLKLHPAVKKAIVIPQEAKDFVIDLGNHDMNEVLYLTDILISDYSSLVFEYAILERPMIFYAYDLEEYLDERSFFYDYDEFVPGPIVRTTDEIINIIKEGNYDLQKVAEFNHRFNKYQDGQSAKRLIQTLIK
ncbi:bifunctional glycosyltransferase/CDP-glycerol:glycerophosphate glycerophosphotransferase [Gottfriedia acidiceleris]|uniref:Bifunctional glycosyltransferase family 2 protein/CDP-glycerol:glycerophosphate glycerophosphotransferase n=1 Tax=Gottfriedia acidiceleris TaxID=371036 RepID=A0ABY4JLN9_9BACI|nr:CDP-glycerol glycerophosphotransferase family protein [Gottfriedia acidiceleris]UPM54763.1 bifunctional glycosyltransferase family 2 protein/CDP-glycerol:glycerophosphate glycerophosphotransferase [Gottfriedia acidiceleris]